LFQATKVCDLNKPVKLIVKGRMKHFPKDYSIQSLRRRIVQKKVCEEDIVMENFIRVCIILHLKKFKEIIDYYLTYVVEILL